MTLLHAGATEEARPSKDQGQPVLTVIVMMICAGHECSVDCQR